MRYIILLALAFLLSCGTQGGVHKEPDPVITPAEGKELCEAACQKMQDLGCSEGDPVPAPPDIVSCTGNDCPPLVVCPSKALECVTCEWFCVYAHEQGAYWNTSCIVHDITSCFQIETYCSTE